jgi:hypothetical protein
LDIAWEDAKPVEGSKDAMRVGLLTVLLVAASAVAGSACTAGSDELSSAQSAACARLEASPRGLVSMPQHWKDYEECNAPAEASHCEKGWILLRAMVSLPRQGTANVEQQKASYLRACETLPEPAQRCLTAEGAANQQECTRIRARQQLAEALSEPIAEPVGASKN